MTRWGGESNENVYERSGMGIHACGVKCEAVEWVKRYTLKWFGHTEGMKNESVKKVYVSKIVGPSSRGRPLGRWKGKVKEYTCETGATRRGGFKQARREYFD